MKLSFDTTDLICESYLLLLRGESLLGLWLSMTACHLSCVVTSSNLLGRRWYALGTSVDRAKPESPQCLAFSR